MCKQEDDFFQKLIYTHHRKIYVNLYFNVMQAQGGPSHAESYISEENLGWPAGGLPVNNALKQRLPECSQEVVSPLPWSFVSFLAADTQQIRRRKQRNQAEEEEEEEANLL